MEAVSNCPTRGTEVKDTGLQKEKKNADSQHRDERQSSLYLTSRFFIIAETFLVLGFCETTPYPLFLLLLQSTQKLPVTKIKVQELIWEMECGNFQTRKYETGRDRRYSISINGKLVFCVIWQWSSFLLLLGLKTEQPFCLYQEICNCWVSGIRGRCWLNRGRTLSHVKCFSG